MDAWRAISPFETIAKLARVPEGEARHGHRVAVAGLAGFLFLELANDGGGSEPRTIGIAMVVYTVAITAGTFKLGMSLAAVFGLLRRALQPARPHGTVRS